MAIIIFLAFSLLLQGALGDHGQRMICEEIPVEKCSFAVASSGKRCTLETAGCRGKFECVTSEVFVNSIREHIETDECISACGADRNEIGISSDSLLDPLFTSKLCSKDCLNNCPNIVDLYSNLALAEGVFLPFLCKSLEEINLSREMSQIIRSSGVGYINSDCPIYAAAMTYGPTVSGVSGGPPAASLSRSQRYLYETSVAADASAPL